MILSRYVELIKDRKNTSYLFNCLTKKWVIFDEKLAEIFNKIIDDIDELYCIHPDLYNILKSESFIVENETIDIQNGIHDIEKDYNVLKDISITINPTLDCNLRCWYCYEVHHTNSVMSDTTIQNTINYISNLLRLHEIDTLNLSFFGGEPLLYFNKVILPIITSVHQICTDTKTSLKLHFTTNGILLSKYVITTLNQITSQVTFQIAFDGSREIHNKVKFLKGDFSCYDLALNNAKKALEAGFRVSIRLNYEKANLLSFKDLIEDFKDYFHYFNLRFQFQQIWQEHDSYEFRQLKLRFFNELKRKYIFNSNLNEVSGHSFCKCYADRKYNIVINYDGLIFRCTARDFIKDNSIGKLTDSGLIVKETFQKERVNNIPYGQICTTCRLLPICPSCSQVREDYGFASCPINVSEESASANIIALFQDLSGINVTI